MSQYSSTPANEFADIARGFCSWCESPDTCDRPEAVAAVWLSKLNAAALLLPQTDCENAEKLPEIPAPALASAVGNLARFNGWYYREFFDPDPAIDEQPCMGDVGDDLLDTYKDVKRGELLFAAGAVTEALWHWSFLHRIHWGRHAVGALFAIHGLFVSKGGNDEA